MDAIRVLIATAVGAFSQLVVAVKVHQTYSYTVDIKGWIRRAQ